MKKIISLLVAFSTIISSTWIVTAAAPFDRVSEMSSACQMEYDVQKETYSISYSDSVHRDIQNFDCKFYVLEGYAYTEDMLIGLVNDETRSNVIHCSINNDTNTLNIVTNEGNEYQKYTCTNVEVTNAVPADLARGIGASNDSVIYENVNIDDNYDLYLELMHSVFWDFEIENPQYSYIEKDFYMSPAERSGSSHSFIVSGPNAAVQEFNNVVGVYFDEDCLTDVGCHTGHSYNQYGDVRGYYVVQTFSTGGTIISLIAVWDLSIEVSPENSAGFKNVSSSMEKVFNLFTSGYNSSNNSITVASAGANTSYVVTNNSKHAMALTGSSNYAYIDDILFRRAEGGNSSEPAPISERVGNALAKLVLPDEFLSFFTTIASICTEIGNWTYDDGTYIINSSDKYCKAFKTDYAGVTYKLYSKFDIRANIGNIPNSGNVVAQYEITVVDCQADNSTHTITARIGDSIAN